MTFTAKRNIKVENYRILKDTQVTVFRAISTTEVKMVEVIYAGGNFMASESLINKYFTKNV
jgi:hypothetical protein